MDYYAIPLELSSITGGVEDGQCPCETAIMETGEEAGYQISEDQLIELGTVRSSKGMDTTVHMFAVDVAGMEQGEAKGDGSQGEEEAHTNWLSIEEAVACKDPLMAAMIARYYGISGWDGYLLLLLPQVWADVVPLFSSAVLQVAVEVRCRGRFSYAWPSLPRLF